MKNKPAFEFLKEELSKAAILLEILNHEQSELSSLSFGSLQEISAKKESALSELTTLTANRHKTMEMNGFELTEDGMKGWLKSLSENAQAPLVELETLWSHLLVTTREAKEQNRINGMLINKHATGVQKALHTLRGTSGDAGTYGPNGQANNYTSPRTLVIG